MTYCARAISPSFPFALRGEHRKKISKSFPVIEKLPLLRSRCDRGISDREEFVSRIIGFLLLTFETIRYFFFVCVIIIRYIRFIKLVFCMIIDYDSFVNIGIYGKNLLFLLYLCLFNLVFVFIVVVLIINNY